MESRLQAELFALEHVQAELFALESRLRRNDRVGLIAFRWNSPPIRLDPDSNTNESWHSKADLPRRRVCELPPVRDSASVLPLGETSFVPP